MSNPRDTSDQNSNEDGRIGTCICCFWFHSPIGHSKQATRQVTKRPQPRHEAHHVVQDTHQPPSNVSGHPYGVQLCPCPTHHWRGHACSPPTTYIASHQRTLPLRWVHRCPFALRSSPSLSASQGMFDDAVAVDKVFVVRDAVAAPADDMYADADESAGMFDDADDDAGTPSNDADATRWAKATKVAKPQPTVTFEPTPKDDFQAVGLGLMRCCSVPQQTLPSTASCALTRLGQCDTPPPPTAPRIISHSPPFHTMHLRTRMYLATVTSCRGSVALRASNPCHTPCHTPPV